MRPASAAAVERPNVLVVLTDDQRWDAMGCAGNNIIQTPNMDRLAAEGTIFAKAFSTTAICCASRASIFTGMYAASHGIEDFRVPLPEELLERSYPQLLRSAGYRTGFVGKWGLGGELPRETFDSFEGFSGQGKYFQEVEGREEHLTKLLGDQSINFIEGSSSQKPWCLTVSFKAPHVQDGDPRQYLYDPALENFYKDVIFDQPATADPAHFEGLPEFIRNSEGRKRWDIRFPDEATYQRSMRGYYRLVTGIDRALGRILEALEREGYASNTVVLFTSDHGVYLGAHGLAGKWLMHEESIRVPMLIRDPRIKADDRASVREAMALNIDVAPTVLSLAGVTAPATVQGQSLAPLLRAGHVPWRREWYYEHHFGTDRPAPIPANEGIRNSGWKYIRYVGREPLFEELYDLENDPVEAHNLANDPAAKDRLHEMRERWRIWHGALENWKPGATPWRDPS